MNDRQQTATTYSSTWVSGPSPIDDSLTDGYAVVWVDTPSRTRIQAFVVGHNAPPSIGTRGVLSYDENTGAPMFRPGAGV